MENIVKICSSFLVLTVVCYLGKAQDLPSARKKITFEVSCKEVNWTEHSQQSCNVIHLTVESLDNVEFEFTNLTFARNLKKFLEPSTLKETCFEQGFQGGTTRATNHSHLISLSSSYTEANGFIYDIKCSRTTIQRYDTKVENMGPDGCVIKPLGVEDECRSQELRVIVQVDGTMKKLNDTEFHVAIKIVTKRVSHNEAADCIITPGFNDTQFQITLSEEECNGTDVFSPPRRCHDYLWNLYTWQNCSKFSFGEQVLHLDWRFDRWVLNNLTGLCRTNLPKMKGCLKENDICIGPNRESFNFYTNLKRSYDDICANETDFSKGHGCFQSIMSNEKMKAAYDSEVQLCSLDGGSNDQCMDYSKNVLCKAFAQYKTNSSCTTLPVTYKYKKIIEDRNNAGGNCTSAQRDPCSLKDPKYKDICSSGSRIEVTFLAIMLLCLANWMKPGK